MTDGYLRIGEFSERVGVSADLLRAWERRYDLLEPDRSEGGFRLYTDTDAVRVRRMVGLMDEGLSAAEAARLAIEQTRGGDGAAGAAPPEPGDLSGTVSDLGSALERFDEATAHRLLDGTMATYGFETVLREVVSPLLRAVGDRWASGDVTVAQEHFTSHLIRGRLLAAARGWGLGSGPGVVLAAPPGEQHDLGLISFGIVLWRRGWRITFLGADTPIDALRDAVAQVDPRHVVVVAMTAERFEQVEDDLADLAAATRLAVGGSGASEELAARLGVDLLRGGPVTAAEELAQDRSSR